MTRIRFMPVAVLCGLVSAGCSGDDSTLTPPPGGTSPLAPPTSAPTTPTVGPNVVPQVLEGGCQPGSLTAPLQMLNGFELRNSVRDLFGEVATEVSVPLGARATYRGALLIDQ
ncbi:MAG: hypothetical protein RJA70_4938, partial [Pseudomonadota bacterium]